MQFEMEQRNCSGDFLFTSFSAEKWGTRHSKAYVFDKALGGLVYSSHLLETFSNHYSNKYNIEFKVFNIKNGNYVGTLKW